MRRTIYGHGIKGVIGITNQGDNTGMVSAVPVSDSKEMSLSSGVPKEVLNA